MQRVPRLSAIGLALVLVAACSGGGTSGSSTTTGSTSPSDSATSTTAAPSGHPGRGFYLVAALPKNITDRATDFGWDVAMTTTHDGDPIVLYVNHDANGDGNGNDSTLYAATWDPKKAAFGSPVAVGPALPASSDGEITATADASTGTIGVAYEGADGSVVISTSDDDGAEWSAPLTIRAHAEGTPRTPSIAMASGRTVVAFADDTNGVTIATVEGTTVTFQPAPAVGGTVSPAAPSAAASTSGTFGVAYFQSDATRPFTTIIDYLALGAAAPVRVIDSENVQNASPSLALAFAGVHPVVGTQMTRTHDNPGQGFWIIGSADQGATFGPPLALPPDGSAGQGFVTRVTASAVGAGAFAYTPNSGAGDDKCGKPKLAISEGGTRWRTCSPDVTKSKAIVPGAPYLVTGVNNSLYIAFTNYDTSTDDPAYLGPGVWIWVIA